MKSTEKYSIKQLEQKTDDRGTLVEVLRSDEVGSFNQIYTANIKPGKTRGGHYHKSRREWFCIIQGEGIYNLKDLETGEDVSIKLSGKDYVQVHIEPLMWHEIVNTGTNDLVFVSAISDLYDKNNTDTFVISKDKL